MNIGDVCPSFAFPGTDGAVHTLESFASKRVLVVIVSCNHCPYVIAYEERLVAFAGKFRERGVSVIAVNANDVARYPEDGMDAMRVRARERGFPFAYVRDDTQEFVRALGARFTPEVFAFDASRRLAYKGRIDDNHRDASNVKIRDLEAAVEALLHGKVPNPAETVAIGCSVKWK